MQEYSCEVLFRPDDESLKFLPEGPYPCGPGRFSWVAIQHGASDTTGSLNIFDLASQTNTTHALSGRPGFAFATDRDNTFVIGLERRVCLFNTRTGAYRDLTDEVDKDVAGTIINDGLVFDGGLVFGTKDLVFKEKKAGLYLWRRSDGRLIRLRSDQICSNGKVIQQQDGHLTLLDIDSPTKTVVAYPLDVEAGRIGEPRIVVDLRDGEVFPDGMIATPNGESVIVAIYNPHDADFGEARQYGLADGRVEAVWRTAGSPQVTCPQLIRAGEGVKLILTTAVERMSPDRQALHPNAGCMFIGDTPFDSLPDQPIFEIPA